MKTLKAFFKNTLEKDLPFVVYRKPGQQQTQATRQHDNNLQYVTTFKEEGFVFAPFDTDKAPVLFPAASMEHYEFDSVSRIENYTSSSVDNTAQKETHIALVQKAIEAIESGVMEKVVLSRKQNIPLKNSNPYDAIMRLLAKYPLAFVYCWYHPKVGLWLGATPETLLHIKNEQLETMALAGTQSYKGNLDVHWGKKEKKEQELVTQTIVENLKPLVEEALIIEGPTTAKAGNLLHLKTTLKARLDISITSIKAVLKALHPTPAICGLPRESAKIFIETNEGYHRSFYTGYLGELNRKETIQRTRSNRNVENKAYQAIKTSTSLYVNLRCMQWQGDNASIYVGGGITAKSNPEKEWEETQHKLETMCSILAID
jgi:isochorismate synthase